MHVWMCVRVRKVRLHAYTYLYVCVRAHVYVTSYIPRDEESKYYSTNDGKELQTGGKVSSETFVRATFAFTGIDTGATCGP